MLKIVRIDFPLLDKPGRVKNRPVVCLTSPIGRYKQVIVAPITSKTTDSVSTDVTLTQTHTDFGTTGLGTTSTIQLHKLISVAEKCLQGQLGLLPARYEHEVRNKLKLLLNL